MEPGFSDDKAASLLEVGRYLMEHDYQFTTVTPETHHRLFVRDGDAITRDLLSEKQILRELFGWNRAVPVESVPEFLKTALVKAGEGYEYAGLFKSRVRVSSLDGNLFFHSGYPTHDSDAVFFGPDSYRFVHYAKRKIKPMVAGLVDAGCGSGVGGLSLARYLRDERGSALFEKLFMTDINRRALGFARLNALLTGSEPELREGSWLDGVPRGLDVMVANPPFIFDSASRLYRHGGGEAGEGLSLEVVESAARYLPRGGQLILYTGAPIVDGRDLFYEKLRERLPARGVEIDYEEIDPDIFGEELIQPAYRRVERLAAVGLTLWF